MSHTIEQFYRFFQGVLIFQFVSTAIFFGITKRKDALLYSLYLLLQGIYFFINAPYTFFNIDDNVVFDSKPYIYLNTPLVVVINLLYVYFLKAFFSSFYQSRRLNQIVLAITIIGPCLIIASTISLYKYSTNQYIFYAVNLISTAFSIYLLADIYRRRIKNAGWVVMGIVFNIIGNMATVAMIILGQFGHETLLTIGYPLLFMRCGILLDMIFYQVAIIKKWSSQEKALALQKMKTQLEVERVRNEISRELHDDIGSTLSGINMYSHMALKQAGSANNTEIKQSLETIQQSAAEMVGKLKDIVWINNTTESEGFTERLQDYMKTMTAATGITPHIYIEDKTVFEQLTASRRYHLYMICKEAVNNAVKHSGAKNLYFTCNQKREKLSVEIRDDGIGFSTDVNNNGNGLKNMSARAEGIGQIRIEAPSDGTGTVVKLEVYLEIN